MKNLIYPILFSLVLIFYSCGHRTEQPCDDHFIKGNNYLISTDFDNSLLEFDTAIKLDAQNANAFYGKGNIYLFKGEYQKAIENFTSAIKIDSKFTLAYYARGGAKKMSGRSKEVA